MRTKLAVTVDDLPFARVNSVPFAEVISSTQGLLSSFARNNIPAIGFVNQQQLEHEGELQPDRVAILKCWLAAGLELGNHTYSHLSANQVSVEMFLEDIVKGEPAIRELINQAGRKLQYFRHPYLRTGRTSQSKEQIEAFLCARNYTIAPVTFDNSDWLYAAVYSQAVGAGDLFTAKAVGDSYLDYMRDSSRHWRKISREMFGREIAQTLLIHANQLNADYGDRLWQMFVDESYEFVSLEQALEDAAYCSPDLYVGEDGVSWLIRWACSKGQSLGGFPAEPAVPEWVSALMDGAA